MLGGSVSTYHTWSVNLQITVIMILGSPCIFFRAVWLFFIIDMCNKGNYMTFSSTELNKLAVYHKVCNPSSKDNMWGGFWLNYLYWCNILMWIWWATSFFFKALCALIWMWRDITQFIVNTNKTSLHCIMKFNIQICFYNNSTLCRHTLWLIKNICFIILTSTNEGKTMWPTF